MEKLKIFFKVLGIVILIGISLGVIYVSVIAIAAALVVFLVYILVTEYHRKPQDK